MTTIVRRPRIQHAVEDATQALVYLEAARRVLGPDPGDSFMDFPMLNPASFLIAHAVELGLGAFLRAEGRKGGLGNHDLRARLEAAEEAGLSPSPMFRKCVVAIDGSHQSKQFRYSKDDQEPFIAPRGAIELVARDLESIRLHVVGLALGAPRAKRLSPLTDAEEAEIQRKIASDPDNPELTNEQLATGAPSLRRSLTFRPS